MLACILFFISVMTSPSMAGATDAISQGIADPVGAGKEQLEKAQSKQDAKREERLKALKELNKGKKARIVVLRVNETGYSNLTLQRNVGSRIARPDAKFYPDVDLYQNGRREPNRSLRPIEQQGIVPDSAIGTVINAVRRIEGVAWDQLTETEWGLMAQELRQAAEAIWFIDRPELREPLFRLYLQIGRAAENMGNNAPPFYETIGNQPVNYYWFLAGALAFEEPGLMAAITNDELRNSVDFYKSQLENGDFPLLTLTFEANGAWNAEQFASDYVVHINGREVLISDEHGLYQAPPGRVDIYLKRNDGMSLSERIDLGNLRDKIYFVRDVARKRMGIDFANQLLEHPNECSPEIDGDILTYLNIYAKLHAQSEVYIALPMAGNPNQVHLWRFDRPTGSLQKVLDKTGGFPVRFAALFGTGVLFNTVNYNEPNLNTSSPDANFQQPSIKFGVGGIPIDFQLRAHYLRLMVVLGYQLGFGVSNTYSDYHHVGNGKQVVSKASGDESLKTANPNQLWYTGVGVVFGKEAAAGLGPRAYLRTGIYNVPHLVDLTAHGGITVQAPFWKSTGRVRPIGDLDVFAGLMIPHGRSLVDTVQPNLGLTASVGATF